MALVTRLGHSVPCSGLLSPQVHFHNDLEVKVDIVASMCGGEEVLPPAMCTPKVSRQVVQFCVPLNPHP